MDKGILKLFILILLTVFLLTVSCSSKPKITGDNYEMRSFAEKDLDYANKEAARGRFENARVILSECKKKAVLTDDMGLIVRCSLSFGNVLYSLGEYDEAFAEWQEAIELAGKIENKELLSVSKIYNARGMLLSEKASAQTVLDEVNRESANIKTDRLYLAFSWQVKGHALRELKSYKEAEDAVKNSLDIHDKDKNLENAAYDWYIIASIRSQAGNTSGALQALESSIAYDRRIENSWGLAAGWRAMGDVYKKTANIKEANDAYTRAKNIYNALGNDKEVSETEKRMEN